MRRNQLASRVKPASGSRDKTYLLGQRRTPAWKGSGYCLTALRISDKLGSRSDHQWFCDMVNLSNHTPFAAHLSFGGVAAEGFAILNPKPVDWKVQVVLK